MASQQSTTCTYSWAIEALLSPVDLPSLMKSEYDNDKMCRICLEPFGERKGHMPYRVCCEHGHVFGFDCVKSWLEGNDSCPCCREVVGTLKSKVYERPEDEDGDGDDDEDEDENEDDDEVLFTCDREFLQFFIDFYAVAD
jgi:Ring finger domain